jgi:hypothetical protein
MPFILRRLTEIVIKTVEFPQLAFQKTTFFGKDGYKKIPCVIFVGFKMVFSKTAPKIPSKRTKNVIKKIYLYRRMCFTFPRFFTDFAPFRGLLP